MDRQIVLLRAILAGDERASAETLRAAFNRDVVAARAVAAQQHAVDATIEVLETERERLEALVEHQRQRNRRLRACLEQPQRAGRGAVPTPDVAPLRPDVATLATKYLGTLGLGEPHTVDKVLWRLVEVGVRGEQLIVPDGMPIVRYLDEEGLIESTPAYGGNLRIRIL